MVACLLGTAGKKAKVLDAGSSSPWKECLKGTERRDGYIVVDEVVC